MFTLKLHVENVMNNFSLKKRSQIHAAPFLPSQTESFLVVLLEDANPVDGDLFFYVSCIKQNLTDLSRSHCLFII